MAEIKESKLHKEGKHIISNSESIWIPKKVVKVDKNRVSMLVVREGLLLIRNAIEEAHLPYNYNPDVQVEAEGIGKLNIEITVTHGIDMEKELKIEKSEIPTIEIVITGAEKYDYTSLTSYVLTKAEKKWYIPLAYIDKLYASKKEKFMQVVNEILAENRVLGFKQSVVRLRHRGVDEDIVLPSDGLYKYKYKYNGVLDEDYNLISVLTEQGEEKLGISIIKGDIGEILSKVKEGENVNILDLSEVYGKYMLNDYDVVDYRGIIRKDILLDNMELSLCKYNENMVGSEVTRRVIDKGLYRKNVMRLGEDLYVSNCDKGYNDYEVVNSKVSADVYKRCRNCPNCYRWNFLWEDNLVDIRCSNRERVIELVKEVTRYKGEG